MARRRGRATPGRIRARRLGAGCLLLGVAAAVAALGCRTTASFSPVAGGLPGASSSAASSTVAPVTAGSGERRRLGESDGAVPQGTTVFDTDVPGVARLEPALLGALQRAATDAARDGVELVVDSGWRSPAYQEGLLREAVSKYGSADEAARWVATPGTSAHVSGEAVDIGRSAVEWLSRYGAAYGLCQIYDNEPWHYELRAQAISLGCPATYADATHDPRLQAPASGG